MYCTVTQWKRLSITKNFNIDDDNIDSDKHVENKDIEREPEKIEYCEGIVMFREQGQQFLPFSVLQSKLCKRPHFLKWSHFEKSIVEGNNVAARAGLKCWNIFAWTMNSVKNRENNNQNPINFFQRGLKQIVKDW